MDGRSGRERGELDEGKCQNTTALYVYPESVHHVLLMISVQHISPSFPLLTGLRGGPHQVPCQSPLCQDNYPSLEVLVSVPRSGLATPTSAAAFAHADAA